MDTVLLRLQTMKCSGFFGKGWTEFTVMSAVDEDPKDLKVVTHSGEDNESSKELNKIRSKASWSAIFYTYTPLITQQLQKRQF